MQRYIITFKPRALKDGKRIPKDHLKRIFEAIENLSDGLKGEEDDHNKA